MHRFPAYLQQLTMESNGKSTRWDGTPVTTETGEIFWGEAGTNGQHAFYQLIHQGTRLIPADFIAFANTANPTRDGEQDVHELFLGNFLAQTKALAFGKTADEVRAEGTAEWMVPARCFTGNRPTTSIFGVELNAHALGELIALYEHITFVEGTVWGLDSYDQWGVELGKQLAKQITPAFHDPWKFGDFGDPTAVLFLLKFDGDLHRLLSVGMAIFTMTAEVDAAIKTATTQIQLYDAQTRGVAAENEAKRGLSALQVQEWATNLNSLVEQARLSLQYAQTMVINFLQKISHT